MNFNDLQEACFRFLGLHDSAQRPDWRRQEVKDALNTSLDEVASQPPFLWNLVREADLSVVASTSVYTLDDWVAKPLFIWKSDTGHKIRFINYRLSGRDHSRYPNAVPASLGPWELTWYPRSSALLSGTAASATEAATSVTGLSGLTDANSVGRMVRLNGEDGDYKVLSQTGGTAATVDRAVRSRLTGLGTTGVGAGYTSVRWELSPRDRFCIKFLPTPAEASTVRYSFLALPRRLVNASDTPEIKEGFHHLLWKGALCKLGAFGEDDASYQRFKGEYEQARDELRKADNDESDSEDSPYFESLLGGDGFDPRPVDTYSRYGR